MENTAKIPFRLHSAWTVFFSILLMLILAFALAFGWYVYKLSHKISKAGYFGSINDVSLTAGESALIYGNNSNYWLGATNPKVTIVEFGDFACPLCLNSFPKLREIGLKYKDDVKIIFRDYPVVTSYSAELAMAARCAGEQGFFWPMYDKLFLNQGVSQTDVLMELAKQIGADTVRFSFCLEQKKYENDINKDLTDGAELGLSGTPTWYINGNKIEGDIPYNTFIQIIDQLIKR